MTVLPQSSDVFSYMLSRATAMVERGGGLTPNVDALQRFAERSGLVTKWGQDEVQRHLAAAFRHGGDEISRAPGDDCRGPRSGPSLSLRVMHA